MNEWKQIGKMLRNMTKCIWYKHSCRVHQKWKQLLFEPKGSHPGSVQDVCIVLYWARHWSFKCISPLLITSLLDFCCQFFSQGPMSISLKMNAKGKILKIHARGWGVLLIKADHVIFFCRFSISSSPSTSCKNKTTSTSATFTC